MACECGQFLRRFELGYNFISGFPDPGAPFEFFEQKFLPSYSPVGPALKQFAGYWWPDEVDRGSYPHDFAAGQVYECRECHKFWLVVPNSEMPSYLFSQVDGPALENFKSSARLDGEPGAWIEGYIMPDESEQKKLTKQFAPIRDP